MKDRISDLQEKKKKKNRKKNADYTLKIIEKIINYNKDAQKNFQLPSKVDKEKSEPKLEKKTLQRG